MFDEVVLSLYAKGLTTGEISAPFAEIYGASVSKETISRITDKVIEEITSGRYGPWIEGPAQVVLIDRFGHDHLRHHHADRA